VAISANTSWLDLPSHRAWLSSGFARLLTFSLRSIRPEGGFHWLDVDGAPMPGRTPQLFLTARMTHVAATGVRLGVPGAGELLDHGMASLLGLHADPAHGGWLSEPGRETRKSTYDHVHVGLAAASAVSVGHDDAARLLEQVVDAVDLHLWDPQALMLRESFAPDWSDDEDYRGANANMHGVEAFLAMGGATGDATWHGRALAVAGRLVDGTAREHGWLLPEHYTRGWEALPEYNRDEPMHPFRPYGATLGHSLEWARLLLDLDRSPLLDDPPGAGGQRGRAGPAGPRPRLGARRGRPGAGLHGGLGRSAGRGGPPPLARLRGHPGVGVAAPLYGGHPLGAVVPHGVGPRRAVLHRRVRHLARRARRRPRRGRRPLARAVRRLPLRRRTHGPLET